VGLATRSPRPLIANDDMWIAKQNTSMRAAYAGGDGVWGCPATEAGHTLCLELITAITGIADWGHWH